MRYKVGVDGNYIGEDGKMYVDIHSVNSSSKALWEYIDSPLIHTPGKDTLIMAGAFTVVAKGAPVVAAAGKNVYDAVIGSGSVRFGEAVLKSGDTMREQLMNTAQHPQLKNIINSAYTKSATTGDGGTADMLR